jgi:BirA family biotin operon repressor/biotin-[acetyl-CoA-carboxylase] ligase
VLVRGREAGGRERKLAGILTEMRGEADWIAWIVVGIGLNANADSGALPVGATSLRAAVGDVSRRDLVQRVLRKFGALRTDPDSILSAGRSISLSREDS